jgi:hypothetical protein
MIDRPDAAQLLHAMADTLTRHVLPSTNGAARHAARVVANLCRILEREASLGADAAEYARLDLVRLLDREGSLSELVALLDESLRAMNTEVNGDFETRAHSVLLDDVRRRLAIDQPGYGE